MKPNNRIMDSNGAEIRIKGKVQGVGFRPYIWQLAHSLGLCGSVSNDSAGVIIQIWIDGNKLEQFLEQIPMQCPPLASIQGITVKPYEWVAQPDDFIIEHSGEGKMDTQIVPDAATCSACLGDIQDATNRRYHYAFTNCTHCGPRFTIIKHIPYDRINTSMSVFPMCPSCQAEYKNPADRRFHAQPNACPVCGPQVYLCTETGTPLAYEQQAIDQACLALANGEIIAVKGLGGFHLACDALNQHAVVRLRQRKYRPDKPLAVMLPDEDWLNRCAQTSTSDGLLQLLRSPAAPIVLVKQKPDTPICTSIAPGLDEIGIMFPANPLQHLLLAKYGKPLVMTSGNAHGKPPALGNEEALLDLKNIADLWLMHNRDIVQRADDSVVRMAEPQAEIIRRSRGYVPDAIELPKDLRESPPILALGADLKNVFCFLRNGHAILSQHMGDLIDLDVQRQMQTTIALFEDIYQFTPSAIAVDAHPAYVSRQIGLQIASQLSIPAIEIYHHHAHIVSCMAEHGHGKQDGPVIGLALDGIGYGKDHSFWGGECLRVDYANCDKIGGLPAVTLPGADLAAKQPWRNLFAHFEQFVPGWQQRPEASCIPREQAKLLQNAIAHKINAPKASSTGRLFDAIAAALGICPQRITWEGQAACQLETLALSSPSIDSPVTMPLLDNLTIDLASFWQQWLSWNASRARKAYAFHYALASAFAQLAKQAAAQHKIKTIVISGGVIHNQLLRRLLLQQLDGYTVLLPVRLPAGDGGIALGQALIATTQHNHD